VQFHIQFNINTLEDVILFFEQRQCWATFHGHEAPLTKNQLSDTVSLLFMHTLLANKISYIKRLTTKKKQRQQQQQLEIKMFYQT